MLLHKRKRNNYAAHILHGYDFGHAMFVWNIAIVVLVNVLMCTLSTSIIIPCMNLYSTQYSYMYIQYCIHLLDFCNMKLFTLLAVYAGLGRLHSPRHNQCYKMSITSSSKGHNNYFFDCDTCVHLPKLNYMNVQALNISLKQNVSVLCGREWMLIWPDMILSMNASEQVYVSKHFFFKLECLCLVLVLICPQVCYLVTLIHNCMHTEQWDEFSLDVQHVDQVSNEKTGYTTCNCVLSRIYTPLVLPYIA